MQVPDEQHEKSQVAKRVVFVYIQKEIPKIVFKPFFIFSKYFISNLQQSVKSSLSTVRRLLRYSVVFTCSLVLPPLRRRDQHWRSLLLFLLILLSLSSKLHKVNIILFTSTSPLVDIYLPQNYI